MAYAINQTIENPGGIDALQFMTPHLVQRVESALGSVGAFGEVRLVVVKGHVRFIEVMRSESFGRRTETEEFEERR